MCRASAPGPRRPARPAHGELNLLYGCECAAAPFEAVADQGMAPLAEEQVAPKFGWELIFQVAEAAGGGTQPQIGERPHRFLRPLREQIGIAVIGPEET